MLTHSYRIRSISSLRHLKDYTQSTMKSDRSNGLASMYIHRNIYVNPSFVLKQFALGNLMERLTLELWTGLEQFVLILCSFSIQ